MNISNRFVIYMTIAVLLGIGGLFVINLNSIFTGQTTPQTYIKHNDVRGMAVKHKGLLYTLNFDQQNQLINIFNQSIRIAEIKPEANKNTKIEQIVIYRFDMPELKITPLAYLDHELIYSIPEWNANGYLIDVSNGELEKLLAQTYD